MKKTFKIGKRVDDSVNEAIIKYQIAALQSNKCMDEYKEARSAIESLTFFNTDDTNLKELAAWFVYTIFKLGNNEKVYSAVAGNDEGDGIDHEIRKAFVHMAAGSVTIYDSLVKISDLINEYEESEEK